MEGYEEEHGGKCITGTFCKAKLLRFSGLSNIFIKSSQRQSTAIARRTKVHTSTSVLTTSSNSINLMPSPILTSNLW
jgi:hypothetical protein